MMMYDRHDGISVFVQDSPKSTIALFDKQLAKFTAQAKEESDDEDEYDDDEEVDGERRKKKDKKARTTVNVAHDPFAGPPPCHVPLETLSNIPTFRLPDVTEEEEKEMGLLLTNNGVSSTTSPTPPTSTTPSGNSQQNGGDGKVIMNWEDLPTPCTVICSRKRFLHSLKNKGSKGGRILEKLNLVLFDNSHEALRSDDVKSQLLEAITLIRYGMKNYLN
jgi:hypothetical protein